MRRGEALRAIAIVALLLPGLVFAAPMAGACGLCDRGLPCPKMAVQSPAAEGHSCCGEAASGESTAPTLASFGSTVCDCGREAPLAVAAADDSAPSPRVVDRHLSVSADVSANAARPVAARERGARSSPFPLLYLVDCVFLT